MPHILLNFTPWKPRHSRSLESLAMKLSLYGPIAFPSQTGWWYLCLQPHSFWSCTLCPFHALFSQSFCRVHMVHQQPPSSETPQIQDHCSPQLIRSSFFPTCKTNVHIFFDLILPSRSSSELFTTISDHPLFKTMIFYPN